MNANHILCGPSSVVDKELAMLAASNCACNCACGSQSGSGSGNGGGGGGGGLIVFIAEL